MKHEKKVLVLIITLCYLFLFIISKVPEKNLVKSMKYLSIISIPIMFVLAIIFIKKKKETEDILKTSLKVEKLIKFNESYDFKKISQLNYVIVEREYSRKSLDRVTRDSIIRYHIENNIDSLRTNIENAIYNINKLNKYKEEVLKIYDDKYEIKSKYSIDKYKKIEDKLFEKKTIKKEEFLITVKLKAYYKSDRGRVFEQREGTILTEDLIKYYNEWQNGKKYEETKKQERKIMNDDIRYNVLKRDNFTCQICGATNKDGAKLEVDHIIPVSKGGKTVMNNLQTLCDRCNKGKSDKTDDDKTSMICPKCGGALIKRQGKYGNFIGCSNFPRCKYTKQI